MWESIAHTSKSRWAGVVPCMLGLVAALPLSASGEIPSFDRVRVLKKPIEIADAQLTDQRGEPFQLSQLNGKATLLFFGYTNCPDVCPIAMETFRQLHDSGAIDNDKVNYVLISVDGDRDTPEAMKTFLAKFSTTFIGLTAEPARVKRIAAQFSVSFFNLGPNAHTEHADNMPQYKVSHSPQAFALDATGRVRAELYAPSVESMAGLVNAILSE